MRKNTMVDLVWELNELKQIAIRKRLTIVGAIEFMIEEARAGEYHDYKNKKYACGKVESVNKLYSIALATQDFDVHKKALQIRTMIMDGDFDEEADESDKEMLRKDLPEHAWPIFGLEKSQ